MRGMTRWLEVRPLLGHDPREPQDQLFSGTVEAIEAGQVAFAQAPCGGGKSLIVVPLSEYVGQLLDPVTLKPERGRVIHSSYTKSQQAQMAHDGRDLVAAGVFTDVVEVRGRSEYVCLRRRRRKFKGETLGDLGAGMRHDLEAALGRSVDESEWAASCSSSDAGCGSECEDDYANRARARAQRPGVLAVVNHAILARDYALGGRLIGYSSSDVLVLDEAHQAPGAFRDALGVSITGGRLRRLAALALTEIMHDAGNNSGPEALEALLEEHADTTTKLIPYTFLRPGDLDDPRVAVAVRWVEGIRAAGEASGRAAREGDWSPNKGAEHAARRVVRVAQSILDDLGLALSSLAGDAYASWITKDSRLEVRPLDVADFARDLLANGAAAVATSATVAGYPLEELGGGLLLEVGSPFDLERQRGALLSDNRSGDDDRKLAEMRALVNHAKRTTKGGAVVLAPTNRVRRGDGRWVSAVELCAEALRADGHRVGVQETTADVPRLVEGLAARTLDVVVGTRSMGEGINLPGDGLVMVILYKLPWPYMGDPLLQARLRKAGDARKWDILRPMMRVNLEQAIGRVIRQPDDRGYVALLDGSSKARADFVSLIGPSVQHSIGSVVA